MDINSSDNIDTREVYLRIDELESLETAVEEAKEKINELKIALKDAEAALEDGEGSEEDVASAEQALDEAQDELISAEVDFDKDAQEELASLRELWEQSERGWMHGVTLIHEDNFVDYIKEYYEDTSEWDALPSIISNNIDWEGVAKDAESDYTVIEWDGSTFYTT